MSIPIRDSGRCVICYIFALSFRVDIDVVQRIGISCIFQCQLERTMQIHSVSHSFHLACGHDGMLLNIATAHSKIYGKL